MASFLKRLNLHRAAHAVHKVNLKYHRYNSVVRIVTSTGRTRNAFAFHLDPPTKRFAMDNNGILLQGDGKIYREIYDERDLRATEFNTLYAHLRAQRKMKPADIVPYGTEGIPH